MRNERTEKSEVLQGTLILLVLRTLQALGPMHGYGIARRIEQISNELLQLNQGTLYPALLRMEQEKLISSRWGASDKNRKAKYYSITAAGLRRLEKMAAAAGGVTNHRIGLFDAVLIKNNHIAAAGGITAALARVKDAGVPVEIEVRTAAELDEALACGAKHLLLDNLSPDEARLWIARVAGRATVELSGGITLETVRAYAEAGPDFISAGAITHSAPAVDLNFRVELC